jgi:CubicO group peptidase (beta-lactamase class C family)
MRAHIFLFVVLTLLPCPNVFSQDSKAANCEHIPKQIDELILAEINLQNLSGAVVLVNSNDKILYKKAFGYAFKYDENLQVVKFPKKMTTAHLFDLASLTKVLATTFAIMILEDQGKLTVDEKVSKYLTLFETEDKRNITIRHLLTHTSGLKPWYPLYYLASNKDETMRAIAAMPLDDPIGEDRHYSDLGFMTLGYVVEAVSGMSLDKFLNEHLYKPLGMKNTLFNPIINLKKEKIAATSHGNPFEKKMVYDDSFGYKIEDIDPKSWDKWRDYTLRGEVNDGNAWYANNGVVGHAGLFSSAADIQVLIDLLLNKGVYRGKQIISEKTVKAFLTKDKFQNGLGWMMDTSLFSAAGAPENTFGHTGFTGTSIVVMPDTKTSIILLTNRQHIGQKDKGQYYNLKNLRQKLFNIVLDCDN